MASRRSPGLPLTPEKKRETDISKKSFPISKLPVSHPQGPAFQPLDEKQPTGYSPT